MPTIRSLLDRYGPPPPEVALDWSWQFAQKCAAMPQEDAVMPQQDRVCLLTDQPWTAIEVDAAGKLLCEQLAPDTVRKAISDLSVWGNTRLPAQVPTEVTSTDSIAANQLTELISSQQPAHSSSSSLPIAKKKLRSQRYVTRRSMPWLIGTTGCCIGLAVVGLMYAPGSTENHATHQATNKVDSTLNTEGAGTGATIANAQNAGTTDAMLLDTTVIDANSVIAPPGDTALDSMTGLTIKSSLADLNVDASLNATAGQAAGSVPGQLEDGAEANMADQSMTATAMADQSTEPLNEVSKTLQAAEAEEAVDVAAGKAPQTLANTGNRAVDAASNIGGEPWLLTRETMRYHISVPPKLNVNDRQSQWTLALEPIAGLVVEPARPITISAQSAALWRIYEPDAKPPRACLCVRARHLGRDGKLELVFCGVSESLPAISIPLAPRWMEPLAVRAQSQAVELRGALVRLSGTVITPEQVPAVMQRKQAMIVQMTTCARLSVVMPEINRLAELADGQVTMHAALKSKPDQPPVATWGRLEP